MTLEVRDGQTVVTALYVERLGIVLHYGTARSNAELAQKEGCTRCEDESYLQAK